MKKIQIKWISISLIIFLLAGCKINDNQHETTNDDIQIVATTTMLTDLLNEIGGERVQVNGLMRSGIDPHGYQPTASNVNAIYETDIVAYHGMHLEGQMGRVFSELENIDKQVFVLEETIHDSDMLDSEDEELPVDPHIWFSVPLWAEAAEYITQSLSAYDSENAEYYAENNANYQEELKVLDHYIRERVREVPENSRYLVTAHDAFQYFGEEYGFTVIGLQGLNTQTEAGTRDVSQLASFIVEHKIKAVFIESSVPTRTIESLKEAVERQGWDVVIGGELFSDSLGDTTQNAETYLKMYRKNIDTIVNALK